MAIACAVLVLAITTLSAFIRLARAPAGCEPLALCPPAQVVGPQAGAASPGVVAAARIAHRIAASAALLLIVGMLVASYTAQPVLRESGRVVLALLGLALFLAVLGRIGADSRSAAVVLGNLLAGFALFALSCRLVALLRRGAAVTSVPPRWAWASLALLLVQIAFGAIASATGEGGGVAAPVHHFASIPVVAAAVPTGVLAWRRARGAGAALIGLLATELAAGGLLVLAPQSLWTTVAHNVLGALLLAALVNVAADAGKA